MHRSRNYPQYLLQLPGLYEPDKLFHSACDSRTVFSSSPIVTPCFSLIADRRNPTICSNYRGKPYFECAIGDRDRRIVASDAMQHRTIRYYERIGLLPQPRRTKARSRRYASDDVARLRFIRRVRQLGFTLAGYGV
jgi:hypothetical protein